MKFRVLIVEDDKPQADRMALLLKREMEKDLNITIAYGADKDIAIKRFDIAIVDLNMPYLNTNLLDVDENAGKYIIDNLVNCNPNIFIIIRTSISNIETVANASNAAGRGCLKYIQKSIQGEYNVLIDEVKAQVQHMKDQYPNRIDYGTLTYIHKQTEEYEPGDRKAYRCDEIYVNGEYIDLPTGRQKAALYKYLINRELWLKDRAVLEFAGYWVEGLWPEEVAKRYKDNIKKYFKFLKDADLELEAAYGMGQHRIVKCTEKRIIEENKNR